MSLRESEEGSAKTDEAAAAAASQGAPKRVTLKEVAAHAGVSLGLASRVLGGYGYFSSRSKQLVEASARELGYRPNHVARALRSGRSKAIGVVVSNILSYHWTTFVNAIEAAASSNGYQVLLGSTDDDPTAERNYLRTLQERNVDGIIVSPTASNEALVQEMIADGMPIVLVEHHGEALKAPRLNIDDRSAAREAAMHLIELGHERIGIVAGSQALQSGRERLAGYWEALEAARIKPEQELVRYGDYRYQPAYDAVAALLDLDDPPTALLVCNEKMTGAALACLKERDVSVPDYLSLVAFDDPPWTAFYRPGITTVRTPRQRVAELALETLLAEITGAGDGAAARVVETEFVIRESTAPPRPRA